MFVAMLVVATDAKSNRADHLSVMVVAIAAAAALIALVAPAAAADPGKRFAHNRGTWISGAPPIEVHGFVRSPRSISIRVQWRGKAVPPEAERAAAEPLPDGGITVQ